MPGTARVENHSVDLAVTRSLHESRGTAEDGTGAAPSAAVPHLSRMTWAAAIPRRRAAHTQLRRNVYCISETTWYERVLLRAPASTRTPNPRQRGYFWRARDGVETTSRCGGNGGTQQKAREKREGPGAKTHERPGHREVYESRRPEEIFRRAITGCGRRVACCVHSSVFFLALVVLVVSLVVRGFDSFQTPLRLDARLLLWAKQLVVLTPDSGIHFSSWMLLFASPCRRHAA